MQLSPFPCYFFLTVPNKLPSTPFSNSPNAFPSIMKRVQIERNGGTQNKSRILVSFTLSSTFLDRRWEIKFLTYRKLSHIKVAQSWKVRSFGKTNLQTNMQYVNSYQFWQELRLFTGGYSFYFFPCDTMREAKTSVYKIRSKRRIIKSSHTCSLKFNKTAFSFLKIWFFFT